MNGKLIVIDGVDASGKETQTAMLYERLKADGLNVMKVSFPNYDDDSSALIKMYLSGQFGDSPSSVNPYAASVFYAVDRFASYKKYWQKHIDAGGIVIADRYVTSNAIHQSAKFEESMRDAYLEWLENFEYNLMGIPRPGLTIFLDMPFEWILRLKSIRNQGKTEDIHERDLNYMKNCYDAAVYCCRKLGWTRIPCTENGEILPREAIHEMVYSAAKGIL